MTPNLRVRSRLRSLSRAGLTWLTFVAVALVALIVGVLHGTNHSVTHVVQSPPKIVIVHSGPKKPAHTSTHTGHVQSVAAGPNAVPQSHPQSHPQPRPAPSSHPSPAPRPTPSTTPTSFCVASTCVTVPPH